MHNFAVLNRFATKTKIGNWYQQSQLNDYNFKQYLHNKANGMNQTLASKTKINFSSQKKQLSPFNDGFLHYGDNISLGNQFTQGVLSVNINQPIFGQQTYAVTTSKQLSPTIRNVFTITKTDLSQNNQSLKYGQKIYITININGITYFLQSLPITPMRSSKFSRFQQVSITANKSSNALWTIQSLYVKTRKQHHQQSIQASQKVIISNVSTRQMLASDKIAHITTFGKQFQVYAKSWLSFNKTQNLYAQKQGHISPDQPLRDQDKRNQWRIFKGRN